MNKLNSFLNLIRFKNLLIIVLIQVGVKFSLINYYLSNSALSNINFSIYLFSLITIIAGGYIINDIYDIEIDKINREETRIVGKELSKSFSFRAYYVLNIIGILSGFYVAYKVNKLWLGYIFIFFVFSLWKYSKNYKATFLIGNLQIAFLTSLSIITLALLDLTRIGFKNNDGSIIILNIILFYAGFSFITTLIREIIKDIEDIEGDKEKNTNTIAVNYGVKKTKKIAAFLIVIPIIGIAFFQYFQYSVLNTVFSVKLSCWGVNLIAISYTILIQILLVLLIIKIRASKTKSDFHLSSNLCKIIMIIGILSIPLFSFLHQK